MKHHPVQLVFVAFLTLNVFAICTRAAAAEPTEAQKAAKASGYFEEGKTHFKLGEFKQALESFKEAYRLAARPAILYNIAQCYRQLSDKENAIRTYKAFLNDAPDVGNRAEVERLIGKLQEQLDSERHTREIPPQGLSESDNGAHSATTMTTTTATAATAPAPTNASATLVATKPEPAKQPLYKKWWLWTAVGVVAVGLGVGLGVGLTRSNSGYTAPGVTF